jgi:hypothetical protein
MDEPTEKSSESPHYQGHRERLRERLAFQNRHHYTGGRERRITLRKQAASQDEPFRSRHRAAVVHKGFSLDPTTQLPFEN